MKFDVLFFSIRCLHREISATYSNVATLSIFHPLFHVSDMASSHHSSRKVCAREGERISLWFLFPGSEKETRLGIIYKNQKFFEIRRRHTRSPKQRLTFFKKRLMVKKKKESPIWWFTNLKKRNPMSAYNAFLPLIL
jgi:hypothetical protein